MTKVMTKQEQMDAAWAKRETEHNFKFAKPVFLIEEEKRNAKKQAYNSKK